MSRQYVGVLFSLGAKKQYVYHNDEARLECGDVVAVMDINGGWKRVTVVAVDLEKPEFATRPVRAVPKTGDAT